MAELVDFVRRGTAKITPQIMRGVYKKILMLKVEFAQLNAPSYPHLVTQLQFLSNLVEDFIDGKAEDVPYVTVAAACYAIIYAQHKPDLIPDFIKDVGMSDDSGVVRIVLIENEKALSSYAEKTGLNWRGISVNA